MFKLKAAKVIVAQVFRDRQQDASPANRFVSGITRLFPPSLPRATDDFPLNLSKMGLAPAMRHVVLGHVGLRVE